MTLSFYVKPPKSCNANELKTFYTLVVKGVKVMKVGLENRISNCKLLAFCVDESRIIAISAIKRPPESYVKKVIKEAELDRLPAELTYEIGYSYTEKDYRRKGISTELKRQLLEGVLTEKGIIFSTTAIGSSQHFLVDHGFTQKGIAYDGENDKNIRYYERDQR